MRSRESVVLQNRSIQQSTRQCGRPICSVCIAATKDRCLHIVECAIRQLMCAGESYEISTTNQVILREFEDGGAVDQPVVCGY